jgi:LacI family transcriptional regulator
MKRPTISDVAAHAGVSRATVSLVVRESELISAKTAAKVRASMAAVGYVYNRGAAEMRSQSSRILGLVVANVRNPYFAELTMAVEEAAAAEGYTVLLGCSSDDVNRQAQILRVMAEHRVDGVILLPTSHCTPVDLEATLGKTAMPHVLVCRAVHGYASNYVGADNEVSGELAGRHLREIGAQSVVFIGGVEHSVPREDRKRGLLTGLGPDIARLAADVPSPEDGTRDVTSSLAQALEKGVPDAIVTYNDMYAFAVLGALRARGIEPGRDVAVIGFDDVPDAVRSFPTLTSAQGFPDQVGRLATKLLLTSSQDAAAEPQQILVQPNLSVRQTTSAWTTKRDRASP